MLFNVLTFSAAVGKDCLRESAVSSSMSLSTSPNSSGDSFKRFNCPCAFLAAYYSVVVACWTAFVSTSILVVISCVMDYRIRGVDGLRMVRFTGCGVQVSHRDLWWCVDLRPFVVHDPYSEQ